MSNWGIAKYALQRRIPSRATFSDFATSNNNDKRRVLIHDLPNGIKHVELNRPEKLNSLDMEMFHSIADAARDIRNDKNIRAVILSGKGRAFCTGLDVKSILSPSDKHGHLPMTKVDRLLQRPSGYEREGSISSDENDIQALGNLGQDIAYLWRDIPVPVIAVLNGMCFGGGLQVALGADMRYATPDCKLSIMESKWGLIPDMSATVTLRELVRIDVAKELTYTGKVIDGVEAERLGLVTRCCDDPMDEALKVTEAIGSRSPDCVSAAKLMYQSTWFSTEQECLEMETKLQKKLIPSWNQAVASAKNFGVALPYKNRQDFDE